MDSLLDELVEMGVVHQPQKPFVANCVAGYSDVGSLASKVLTVRTSVHFVVQLPTPVSAVDIHWGSCMLPQGLKHVLTKCTQIFYLIFAGNVCD